MTREEATETMTIFIAHVVKLVRTEVAPEVEPYSDLFNGIVDHLVLELVKEDRLANGINSRVYTAFMHSVWYKIND